MRTLLIHNEATYYAGAEKVLHYFLEAFPADADLTLAVAAGSRVEATMPARFRRVPISSSHHWSPRALASQAFRLYREHRNTPFDVVHGWAAREWDLTSLVGWLCSRPTIGTLHDHPQAAFITRKRQILMRAAARWGLSRVVCVSQAVARACADHRYPPQRLQVIHNGLPAVPAPLRSDHHPIRLGFLGVFSARKGIDGLFAILRELAHETGPERWELRIAGEAADTAGRSLVEKIVATYRHEAWWPQVAWLGWIDRPLDFLSGLDLLIFPSADFDPLPTVLIEAGYAGTPVLAAEVGGVPEIVRDDHNGWLFQAGDWATAARKLSELLRNPQRLTKAGQRGRVLMGSEFAAQTMVAEYLELYSSLASRGGDSLSPQFRARDDGDRLFPPRSR